MPRSHDLNRLYLSWSSNSIYKFWGSSRELDSEFSADTPPGELQRQLGDKLGHRNCGARTALEKSTQWGKAQASGVTAVPGNLVIFGKLVSSSSRQVFGKELSYELSGKEEFLGLLGTKKGHNIRFVYVRQDILSRKRRNMQKKIQKRERKTL